MCGECGIVVSGTTGKGAEKPQLVADVKVVEVLLVREDSEPHGQVRPRKAQLGWLAWPAKLREGLSGQAVPVPTGGERRLFNPALENGDDFFSPQY